MIPIRWAVSSYTFCRWQWLAGHYSAVNRASLLAFSPNKTNDSNQLRFWASDLSFYISLVVRCCRRASTWHSKLGTLCWCCFVKSVLFLLVSNEVSVHARRRRSIRKLSPMPPCVWYILYNDLLTYPNICAICQSCHRRRCRPTKSHICAEQCTHHVNDSFRAWPSAVYSRMLRMLKFDDYYYYDYR